MRLDGGERLSGISTAGTALRAAHAGSGEAARAAQELLTRRYGGAVYRYLLRALGDAGEAEDLAQEFALGLVRGDYRHADPQRGRFRNYVKSALFHLVSKHRRTSRKLPQALPDGDAEHHAPSVSDGGAEFDEDWRNELLTRAWDALAAARPAYFAALRLRAGQPKLSSPELAEALGQQLGKPQTPEAARQLLHRARDRFAELLIDEVAHSLDAPSADALADELRELNLLEYCRTALERYSWPSH